VVFRRRLSKRGWGIFMILLSLIFLITFSLSPTFIFQDHEKRYLMIGSYATLVVGAYLVAGPLGVLVSLIPAISSGCFGGGGGGGAKPEPDLGEPPEPPSEND